MLETVCTVNVISKVIQYHFYKSPVQIAVIMSKFQILKRFQEAGVEPNKFRV